MKELVKNINMDIIIEWFMKIKYKDNSKNDDNIIWASDEDKQKGNFSGMCLHKGNAHSVKLFVPKIQDDPYCTEFISVELKPETILKIAERIKKIQQTEENSLCEID